MNPRIIIFAAAAVLSGCATPMVDLSTANSAVQGMNRVHTNIRTTATTAARVDETSALGMQMRWATGREFAARFTGDESAAGVLELVESNLKHEITKMGFEARFTYEAKVKLRAKGRETVLSADASRVVHGFETPQTTIKTIVGLVLTSIGAQADDFLKVSP